MSIVDNFIKQILADNVLEPRWEEYDLSADDIPADEVLNPDIFFAAPELQVFHERVPDSGENIPGEADAYSVLGTYHWMTDLTNDATIYIIIALGMAKPGMITLYSGNIEAYWKSLIRHAYLSFPFITAKDTERILTLLVHSVYQHERFHHVCDFCRRMLGGGTFDPLHEEALAVAWEWHWLKARNHRDSFYSLMHPTLRRLVIQAMFDYRAPGYRDWRRFANHLDFYDGITDYLYSTSTKTFAGRPFNFAAWALKYVPDDTNRAWNEQILR